MTTLSVGPASPTDWSAITTCRGCGSGELVDVLAFGPMPLADGLLDAPEEVADEPRFPLTLAFCPACALVQIKENVRPDILFGGDYPYFSSFSPAWLEHNRKNAEQLIRSRRLNEKSLVVEVACNDGYLLKNFAAAGIPTLGIDPAPGPVAAAREAGLDVREAFFTEQLAGELAAAGTRADVLLANNVLAHVPDLIGFARGIRELLTDDGVAVIENAYVRDLIDHGEFDTIYHEHHCYFSATSAQRFFAAAGLHLNDVERLPTHGGSIRMYVGRREEPPARLHAILEEERAVGLDQPAYYQAFADRARSIQQSLVELLHGLKKDGARIAAYAAAAKGATMLNACGLGAETIDFVVDRNVHKHGRLMPGVHLPISPTERLLEERPDYTLILAWNFKDEILAQQQAYTDAGGKFIVPIPEPRVL